MEHLLIYENLSFGKLLGRGQFGSVYRGQHDNVEVAIKKISQDNDAHAEMMLDRDAYFKREVGILASVRHPHVLKFIGIAMHGSELFIVTEFVDGGDLHQYLKRNCPPWHERVSMAIQMASALQYLHDKNIVHRDVKTENVLLDQYRRVKLCDFGFAREVGATSHKMNTFCGSEFFEAPEIMFCLDYDERVDTFSYGLVLCELLARKAPSTVVFKRIIPGFGIDPAEIRQHAEADCPEQLLVIAGQCCDDTPDNRPSLRSVVDVFCELYRTLTGLIYSETDDGIVLKESSEPIEAPMEPDAQIVPVLDAIVLDSDRLIEESAAVAPDTASMPSSPMSPTDRPSLSVTVSTVPPLASVSPRGAGSTPVLVPAVVIPDDLEPRALISLAAPWTPSVADFGEASEPHNGVPVSAITPDQGGLDLLGYLNADSEETKLQRLQDVLYFVNQDTLRKFLTQANGDVENAITLFLNDGRDEALTQSPTKPAAVVVSPPPASPLRHSQAADAQPATAATSTTSVAEAPAPIVHAGIGASPPAVRKSSGGMFSKTGLFGFLRRKEEAEGQMSASTESVEPAESVSSKDKLGLPTQSSPGSKRRASVTPAPAAPEPLIRIGRLSLVAALSSNAKVNVLSKEDHATWTIFLTHFTQALPVTDRQTRTMTGRLKTFRKSFSGTDVVDCILLLQPQYSRKAAIELAGILLRLGIYRALNTSSFKDDRAALYRYRHDEFEFQSTALAASRKVRAAAKPAAGSAEASDAKDPSPPPGASSSGTGSEGKRSKFPSLQRSRSKRAVSEERPIIQHVTSDAASTGAE